MELTTRTTDFPNTLQEATECIKSSMRTAAQAFVGTGYYLKYIRDKQMYQEAGYIDIWEYGKGELGLSKTMVSRYMNINDRFSQNGNSPILLEEYKDYGYSKLSEMLSMTNEEIEAAGITEATTIARIREVKKELREEEPEIQEQIPGQTEITDFLPETEEKNVAATSQLQGDKLKPLTDFAIEYYKHMSAEQHALFTKGEEEKFISCTKEQLLPFFKERREVLHYVLESGQVEISPDGYIKLSDGVVRKWQEVYTRLTVLKALKELPESCEEEGLKKYIPEYYKTMTPKELITHEMAQVADEELKINNIEIPEETDEIIKTIRDYYEPTYIAFKCGYNTYMAEPDGAGEVFTVHRLNSGTGSPEARDIFEICIEDLVVEIDGLNATPDAGEEQEQAADEESAINSTAHSHLEERKSDWKQGIFENDNDAYGWARSEMVERLLERLEKQKLEIEDIDGEPVKGPGNQRRYAFISEDKEYVEFLKETEENEDEIDFKVSIERLKEEFEVYKNKINAINTSAETEKQKKYTLDEMAIHIYENMLEDEEKIIAAAGNYERLKAAIKKRYSGSGGCTGPEQPYVEYNGKEFTFNSSESIAYDLTASVILDLLEEGELKKVKPEEEVVEAEVITESSNIANAAARDSVIKDVQYNGCAGKDEDGESYVCPPRRKPCDMECKWKPNGQAYGEKIRICTECWETYVKELIERDRNGEITPAAGTVSVKNDTIEEQPELPILKNNEQRKAWIEKFEEWQLWIDNKETQERFYRYTFKNGDAFVIRQAYTQRPYWDYTERKSIKKPGWAYKKEYIVRKEEDLTLYDSETSTTAMVEYLKNMQKKQED